MTILRGVLRAAAAAALSAMAGAASVVGAFAWHPALTLEMDRDLPRNLSGVYPPERTPAGETFAWTGPSATLTLPGLDRRVPWMCTLRLRGARPGGLPQPIVEIDVDGVGAISRAATNDMEEYTVEAPVQAARPGLILTLTSSEVLVPGPQDPRRLGVQIDRLACRPVRGLALPPWRAIREGLLSGAIWGAAFGAIGVTPGSAIGAALLLDVAQAFPLTAGPAPYSGYVELAATLAFRVGLGLVLLVGLTDRLSPQRLRQTARFAMGFTAAALYLKLLALLHPSKLLVDAVFHAHRLESILAGRYFFTQPLGAGGIQFPYAIALYVVAAPWAHLISDHVMLLRTVVLVAEAAAALLLYPVVARSWDDRLAGAMATALVVTVPINAWVVSNANLTNAFGQAAALIAAAAVVLWSQAPAARHIAAWIALISLALLSHVSTFSTLTATLVVLSVLFWWRGGPLRKSALRLFVATAVAVSLAVGVYYGHFLPVYRDALRLRVTASAAAPASSPPAPATAAARPVAGAPPARGLLSRTTTASGMVVTSLGWALLVLAAAGGWRIALQRRGDPLTLAIIAWAVAFTVMFGVAVMRIDPAYQRYAFEFVTRISGAVSPAVVILAGVGSAWAWRAGPGTRAAAVVLLAVAMLTGIREWVAMWR